MPLNFGQDGRWSPDGKTITYMVSGALGLRSYWTASFAVDSRGVLQIGVPRQLLNVPGDPLFPSATSTD